MFVTCSIQSLKFCRSHHYVQRGLRLLQFLRLLHLQRLLCLPHLPRLQSLIATCYRRLLHLLLSTLSSIATRILCQLQIAGNCFTAFFIIPIQQQQQQQKATLAS